MLFHAKNERIQLNNYTMDYIRFGTGEKILIILRGLGDGLHTVKGTALPMSFMYRRFTKEYTVYVFSRKDPLPEGYTTYDMALDQKAAMDALNISKASVLGVSMGGMIAQHLAIHFPETIEKLVLVVTSSRPNGSLTESISEWLTCAKRGDHTSLMDSNVRRIYTEKYYHRNKWLIPIMGKITKPKSYNRFFVQADACLNHNAFNELAQIQSPTLVIGGEKDQVLSGNESKELAHYIPGARLHMYAAYGHGLYEEAKDFGQVVLDFLKQ